MPTEKGGKNAILFTKEQFNAGLRFPLPALFKEFLHFSKIPPIFIHPNLVRVLMGCSIINMLVSAHLPSLQMVTELPDSTKGGAKGLVAVWGGWAGAIAASVEAFFSELYLKNSGFGIEGPPCGLGGKRRPLPVSAKLFEIDPKERAYKTLLSARNLTEVVREPQEYVINILPRKLAKDEIVPGEHYNCSRTEAGSGLSSEENFRKKGEAGEEAWEGCEGTHSSKEFPLHKLPMRGSNDRGASKCCSALYLKRPRTHVGVESLRSLLSRGCAYWPTWLRKLLTMPLPASPFSYAELEVKLKQITPDWKAIKPSG
ncbi:hypothetical protein CK203_114751 [Vitis vinifera]|uniref:Uncharacterized protein n=1 Tax=Vitis vinifera TaxID=29760 RepID=A0A438F8S7_VITVI|nr:hypothetical protein CK203_114751 [Vitis vinifera]